MRLQAIAAIICAAALSAFGAGPGRPEMPPWKLALQEKLEHNISCAFQATPLTEVLQYFRATLGINIVLDESAAASADKPVTLTLQNIPARSALDWSLKQAKLRYVLADNAVVVADPQTALRAEPASFRQYDVNDLLLPSPGERRGSGSSSSASGVAGTQTSSSGASSASGSYKSSGGTASGQTGARGSAAAQELLGLIVAYTGPENWDVVEVIGASSGGGLQSESREDRF